METLSVECYEPGVQSYELAEDVSDYKLSCSQIYVFIVL